MTVGIMVMRKRACKTIVLQVVLGRWCRQEDVVVGMPFSGRSRPQLEGMVGNFINMLPIRTGLPPATPFQALLKGVQQSITDALTHAELPFTRLVEALGRSRHGSRTPIFQAMVDLKESSDGLQSQGPVQRFVKAQVCSVCWSSKFRS